jgi:hypothetical protein
MSVQQKVLGLVDAARKVRRAPLVGMKPLDEAPVSLTDGLFVRTRLKPQDLVSFLLGHRAALRIGPPPRVRIALSVFTPWGVPAVQIRQ